MGVLYEIDHAMKTKKRCTVCGCHMDEKHDGDICENCLDDMSDQDHKKIDPEFMRDIMVRR